MKSQKHPISPSMLLQLHDWLHLESSFNLSFQAICLVAIFGIFRKSHLLLMSPTSFDPRRQLTEADFKIFPWLVLIDICLSKTIQIREHVLEIPLPHIPCSPLCPTVAIINALHFTASGPSTCSQAFWSDDRQLVKFLAMDHLFPFCTLMASVHIEVQTGILHCWVLTLGFDIICLRCSH